MSTEGQRGGPALRPATESVQEGDVVHVIDLVAEYGVVTRVDPIWIQIPVRGMEVRAHSLPDYQLVDVDEVIGTDTAGATHLLDRGAHEVIVMALSENRDRHHEVKRFDVGPREIGEYLAWLVDRHDREWIRDSMPPEARAALDAHREENGGASA